MSAIVVSKIFEMLVIFICGFIVYKVHLIDAPAVSKLSNLLLMFISPLLIFESYQIDFDKTLLQGLLWSLLGSAICFAAVIFLSEFIFPQKDGHSSIEKMATVYSNCGFIGIPLADGVLGAEGVFYATAFNAMFNLMLWTHGVLIMNRACGRSSRLINPENLKNLITPPIIAIFLGILCFVFQLRLPSLINEPLDIIGDMNTPIAMMVAGANLAQSEFLKSLRNLRIYFVCAVKLLLFPLISLLILWALPLSFNVAFTLFLCISCPTGAVSIMFADRYDQDAPYASEIFVISTVLCVITIPLLSFAAENLLR